MLFLFFVCVCVVVVSISFIRKRLAYIFLNALILEIITFQSRVTVFLVSRGKKKYLSAFQMFNQDMYSFLRMLA